MVADGMPLIWASRILGKPLPQRVAGSTLIFNLSAAAATARRSIFFLGGNPGTADMRGHDSRRIGSPAFVLRVAIVRLWDLRTILTI